MHIQEFINEYYVAIARCKHNFDKVWSRILDIVFMAIIMCIDGFKYWGVYLFYVYLGEKNNVETPEYYAKNMLIKTILIVY